jgi:predicted DsbA family dithiol-disulfide isomerase
MQVEIWSDIVCPWCYIGKRRFEAALAEFPHRDEVEVTYRSFQLDPEAPRDSSGTVTEALAQKYGVSRAQAEAMNDRVSGLAAEEGLEYHLETARRANTSDAHRLIHFAAAHGRQGEMKERLLRAYFTESADIGDIETLAGLAAEIGLTADEARETLAGDIYADAVRADERRAKMLGITGVPFFVIDEKYGVSGAQPTELFADALAQAWAETHPLMRPASLAQDAGVCEGDICDMVEN